MCKTILTAADAQVAYQTRDVPEYARKGRQQDNKKDGVAHDAMVQFRGVAAEYEKTDSNHRGVRKSSQERETAPS